MSIVLAVYDPPLRALRDALDAIADQTVDDWECLLVDDGSTRPDVRETLRTWSGFDPGRRRLIERPVNGGIAAATNDGLDAARGWIVTICDHDDLIDPTAIERVIEHFTEHPDDDVVYTDEQLIDADGRVLAHYGKPDYSPRRHLGHHYLAHLVAARRDAVGDLRVRADFEPAQDYDFYLRVIERVAAQGRRVGHIPEVLYSWRAIAGSSALDAAEKPEMAAAVERCSQAALDRRGIAATATTVRFDGRPTTSVLLEATTPPPDVAVIAIDPATAPGDVNAAVTAANSPVVVLSPDAAEFGARWAAPLAVEAVRPDVGLVGPLIVDATGDHILSVGRVVRPRLTDRLAGEPADEPGPWGAFFVAREVSAVAPWGVVVSREAFQRAGGLDTGLASLDVAIAELGVRLERAGRSTLWTPAATLRLSGDVLPSPDRLLPDDLAGAAAVDAAMREAIERAPELAEERYDVVGIAHLDVEGLDPFQDAAARLHSGEIALVTSDVFDTVVTRAVATPSDVFLDVARALDLPDHVTPPLFAEARRDAERRARRAVADRTGAVAPECTIEEIWSLMPSDWCESSIGMATELEVEAAALQPIPETVALFALASELGIPVVLVSDVYLDHGRLAALLAAAGLDPGLIDEVVTSADHRLGKAHGLLAQVITDRGVDPTRVLHIGDNEVADIDAARHLGASAIHVHIPREQRQVELPAEPLRTWSRATGSDLGISAAVRATLIGAPLGEDPAYQFGVAAVGPVLAGFSRWVADSTTELGAAHVHCLLREGATIAELMRSTAPDGPTPVPLHVSRWVTMRAAVVDGTTEELLTALSRRADLTADHVVEAFGCDVGMVRQVLGGERVAAGEVRDACIAISRDDALRHAIVAASAVLRERVIRYLEQRLRGEPDTPIVVADVGWGGTIQEGLTRILRAAGDRRDVVGLYLALSEAGERRLAQGARMRSYLPNATDDAVLARASRSIAHHADTIERVMTPAIGTLLDITDGGEPVCRDPHEDPIPPTLAAAQRGVRDVTARLADRSLGLGSFDDRRWSSPGLRAAFAALLADVITLPSRPLAEALGAWPHDDVAGTAHRSIAGAELATAVRYANARDVELLDPAGRSWLAGVAGAVNPVLSGQLAAAEAGVPLDRIAPESENGMARIAAFEIGADLAAAQVGRTVAVAPAGWSVLRLDSPIESLRSVRFDAGEHDALVDVANFSVTLRTADGWGPPTRHLDLTDDDIVWVGAHPIDHRRFAQRAGGHVLIDIDPRLAPEVRSIEVVVAFRCWRLDDDSELTRTPLLRRIEQQGRRVGGAVRRRLR